MKNSVFIILLALFLILPFSSCTPQKTPTANEPNLPEAQSPNVTKPPPPIPSPPDPLTDIVVKADLIVLGTITDKKYEIVTVGLKSKESNLAGDNTTQEAKAGELDCNNINTNNITPGKFTYTIFTLSIEEMIKGDPTTKQVFIKVIGGLAGSPGPEPPGPYFSITDRILTLLNRLDDNVYTVPYGGIQWIESPSIGAKSVVKLQDAIGHVIQIMKANNIPISLKITYLPPVPPPVPATPSPADTTKPGPIPQPTGPIKAPVLTLTPIDPIHELTQLIEKSAFIVLGTITDKRYEVRAEIQYDKSTRDYVYTIFTLTVEKVIKGDPDIKEVFIGTPGGLGQNPRGWYFALGNRGLFSLDGGGNIYKVSYLFWGESTSSAKMPWSLPPMTLQETIGLIIRILKDNNIPIALPESEWPPLPATIPVLSQTK